MHAVSLFTPIFAPLVQECSIFGYLSSVVTKTCTLAMDHFSLLQNGCVAGFGCKEILVDFLPLQFKSKPRPKEHTFKLIDAKEKSGKGLDKIDAINKEFSLVHGIFYLNCGGAGIIDSLHGMNYLNLSPYDPIFKILSSGLFLFVNFYSLERNINLYTEADLLGRDEKYSDLAWQIKISAVLGILNNLGYIIITLCSLFPVDDLCYLVLVCLTIFVGCIKILYDFFFLTPKLQEAATF